MKRRIAILMSVIMLLGLAAPFVRVHAESDEDGENTSERSDRTIVPLPIINTSPAITNDNVRSPIVPTINNINSDQSLFTNSSAAETITPLTAVTPQTPTATKSSWPWYITRAFGIASFLLLFASAFIGILMTTGAMHRVLSPTAAWSLHRTTGIFLILSIFLHLIGLVFDKFINLRIVDILIPFVSPYRPLLVALGIVGFYFFIPVIWTSLAWVDKHSKFWRFTHTLSFPMYLAIFFHALLIGTDSKTPWMQTIYWSTGLIMAILILYRLIWKYRFFRP